MLRVAIACENSDSEGTVWAHLLQCILGEPVDQWSAASAAAFSGFATVYRLARVFLTEAAEADVHLALLAIDNDGRRDLHPEHSNSCEQLPYTVDAADVDGLVRSAGCRVCSLSAVIPPSWQAPTHLSCVVVPVQTLETWILCARGETFVTATPEQQYDRRFLKRRCYGKSCTDNATRARVAREAFSLPEALDRLRLRPSFQRFESCIRRWSAAPGVAT